MADDELEFSDPDDPQFTPEEAALILDLLELTPGKSFEPNDDALSEKYHRPEEP